jgi:hypothetical protein
MNNISMKNFDLVNGLKSDYTGALSKVIRSQVL